MKQYQKYELPGGEVVFAEVEEPASLTGEVPASRPEELAGRAASSLEAALEKIKPIARAVVDRVADISASVNEVNVEFSVKLSGSVGLVLATVGSEANFKVSLKWVRTPAPSAATPRA